MRLEIKYSEHKTGMMSKTTHFKADYRFFFTEEEKAILEYADLHDETFLERTAPSDNSEISDRDADYKYTVEIRHLLNGGFYHSYTTRRGISDFSQKIKSLLPNVKSLIESYADLKLEDETIEL